MDLNIPFGDEDLSGDISGTLAQLADFGYTTFVLNTCVDDISSPGSGKLSKPAKFELPGSQLPPMRLLRRLTLVLDKLADASSWNSGSTPYDIIAVQPMNEGVFAQACETLDVDMIAIDGYAGMPFPLRQATVERAVKRGVFFELTYAKALGDSTARRHFISNAIELVRATRGRNLVLSSGARRPMDLRSPNDIANLAMLFGLDGASARDSISVWPDAVLRRADLRRYHAGALRCVPVTVPCAAPASQEGGGGIDQEGPGPVAVAPEVV